jgi:hypothetical protein
MVDENASLRSSDTGSKKISLVSDSVTFLRHQVYFLNGIAENLKVSSSRAHKIMRMISRSETVRIVWIKDFSQLNFYWS